ncbi:MAG: hypothetical protein ACK2UU_23405 [Anaerolineae bacterium]
MGRKLAFVIIVALTVLSIATPVLAGGDKNRGEVGVGTVEQHQVNWDVYESQRLIQNQEQVLTQNQEQARVRVREQLHKNSLKYTWF